MDINVIYDKSHINLFFKKAEKMNIAVLGDVMLDCYIYGDCQRVSPEAPVLVVNRIDEDATLGGAGNVVNNIYSLGANTVLFTVIGLDLAGKKIQHILEEKGISLEGVFKKKNGVTTEKTRILAQNQQVVRIDHEDISIIDLEIELWILEKFRKLVNSFDALIISDYQKGVCSPSLIRKVIDEAQNRGIPTFVDSKSNDYSVYKGATCITPNVHEASAVLGRNIISDKEVEEAVYELHRINNIPNVLITRGERGMTLYSNKEVVHVPTVAKQVFDVSGAGDTVIATLAVAVTSGIGWKNAVNLTNIAAGTVVGKVGTAPVNKKELYYVLLNDSSIINSKIFDQEQLKKYLLLQRMEGKKIVFTNGCFDILHAGHVKLLEKARSLGDILVVGLNSDTSVSRLKGKKRPINSQKDRSYLLAALSVVDVVVVFEEDTPEHLIKTICPNILVKGADYKKEDVVGAEFVTSYKGEVVLVPLAKGKSTTSIINKLEE